MSIRVSAAPLIRQHFRPLASTVEASRPAQSCRMGQQSSQSGDSLFRRQLAFQLKALSPNKHQSPSNTQSRSTEMTTGTQIQSTKNHLKLRGKIRLIQATWTSAEFRNRQLCCEKRCKHLLAVLGPTPNCNTFASNDLHGQPAISFCQIDTNQ